MAQWSAVKPGCIGVRVGAFLEQITRDLTVSRERGERRRADAPGVLVVDVRASLDEQLRRHQIADPGRKHQRRVAAVRNHPVVFGKTVRRHGHHLAPALRARMDVGSAGEQHLDDLWMFLRDRPHQRRLAARAARVRVAPLASSCRDGGDLPDAGGDHQRRLARKQRGVRVGAGLQQRLTIARCR